MIQKHSSLEKEPELITFWVRSVQWNEADVGRFAQKQVGAAKRRGGGSQTESWVDGVQRIPLAASAEQEAGSDHRPLGKLP